ncbi:MAG TPA: hypothetical protein VFG10_15350 [Saprospiraceae bacterium]|nr:hypothetical protein [Saprospiraceae bacterium]
MKNILLCCVVLISACTGTTPEKAEIKETMLHKSGKGYVIFLNIPDTTFYLLQVLDEVRVPEKCGFKSLVNDTLAVQDLANDSTIKYSLDENIYGIGSYRGNEYFELLTDSALKNFKMRDNIGDLISLISCLCHPVGEIHTCVNGEINAGTCKSRLAHKVGKAIWVHQCEITCSQGYNACCN